MPVSVPTDTTNTARSASLGHSDRIAFTAPTENAGGMAKALATLMERPFGPWLLGATATGLIAHGVFTWALMRYRDLGGDG